MQKIMFNDKYGLTKAVLQGRKPMTRREISKHFPTEGVELIGITGIGAEFRIGENYEPVFVRLPYKVGEEVAIAQSYKDAGLSPNDIIGHIDYGGNMYGFLLAGDVLGWNNKMFVRSSRMPHAIRITDVKVERLQDISVEDCMREGIVDIHLPILYPTGNHAYTFDGCSEGQIFGEINGFCSPIAAFAALIDKVSGRGTWARNPWVFAYSFELVKIAEL